MASGSTFALAPRVKLSTSHQESGMGTSAFNLQGNLFALNERFEGIGLEQDWGSRIGKLCVANTELPFCITAHHENLIVGR